jgi:hypothetical protein
MSRLERQEVSLQVSTPSELGRERPCMTNGANGKEMRPRRRSLSARRPKAEEGKQLSEVAVENVLLVQQPQYHATMHLLEHVTNNGSSKVSSTFIIVSDAGWHMAIRKRDSKRARKASNSRAQIPIPPTTLNPATVASCMILHGLRLPHKPQHNPTSLGLEDMEQLGSVMGRNKSSLQCFPQIRGRFPELSPRDCACRCSSLPTPSIALYIRHHHNSPIAAAPEKVSAHLLR